MNICQEGSWSQQNWRRTGQPLWGSLCIYVLSFCNTEADPGKELKVSSPYHLSSFLLPTALGCLTYLKGCCCKVTGICFSQTVLRYGPSHIGLWDPAESSSPHGLDAAVMGTRGLGSNGAVPPPRLHTSPRSRERGRGGEGGAESPFHTLMDTSPKGLTFCLVLSSLITLKTGTTNIQISNCCSLRDEPNASFLSAGASRGEYIPDPSYK